MKNIIEKATLWLSDTFDSETQQEIQQLITDNSDDLTDRFYKDLESVSYTHLTLPTILRV